MEAKRMDKKGKRNVAMKVSMNGQNKLANDQQNGIDNNQYYLETDPDIHNDVEIVLPKDNRQSARSRTTMSAKSRKTVQSVKSEARENIVRSRGRPMKPHETEPFLSIDTLPPEKSFVTEKSTYNTPATTARTPKPVRQASGTSRSLEAQLQRMTAYMSPYNQQTPAPPRSVPSRAGRITPANTPFQSPNKQMRQPNHHIKSPFKHSVSKPESSPDGRQTPSMGMKERTALAAFHVHKMLAVAGEKDAHKMSGRLQKGKLKPLYPVNVQGPSIEQCRGIISEARSYQPSPSRTLQRRMNLINQIPNVHEYLYERPNTVESVHQTSIASSIDDYDPEAPDTNRSLPDEILYAQEPSNLAPENTFMPEATNDDLMEEFHAMNVDDTPRMFATEIGVKDADEMTTKTDLTVSDHIQHELHVSESTEEIKDTQDSTEPVEENYNNNTEMGRETQTSGFEGRIRSGSPSKSVRFAQGNESENSKEMKQMRNETIVKQQRNTNSAGSRGDKDCTDNIDDEDIDQNVIETVSKKNKETSKGTCKSEDVEVIAKKDDDDSDDHNNDKTKDGHSGKDSNTVTAGTSGNNTAGGNINGSAEGKDSGKAGSEPKDSGNKRAINTSQANSVSKSSARSKSQSRDRSGKDSSRKPQIRKSQDSAKTSQTKKDSARSSRCSRFEQSQASKHHINKLEVSSVIHSVGVSTSLRPESPKRNRSRSASPSRQKDQPFQFFAPMSRPCYEAPDDFDCYHDNSQRSKVKFMIEGEESELETIFIEDDNDVDIKPDKVISYDVLDSEIAMLRAAIQNSLTSDSGAVEEIEDSNTDINEQENTESEAGSESDIVEMETERENTERGDYSSLLEKYRQRCMERSETFGAISATLVTPRDPKTMKSHKSKIVRHRRDSSVVPGDNGSEGFGNRSDGHTKLGHPTCLSDSGHGSADNLSELSHSTSKISVPKLELGESTSDLGMDTSRSDVTVTNDNTDASVTIGDAEEEVEESSKNLLEIVCDQLSTPVLQDKKPIKRRDVEEDVSNLQVIATTKSISKNSKKGSNSSSKAPFPPLCFTINARPPQGYLYYFAYGPDMNPNRLSSYIQRDIKDRYWGLLFGFNLVFNKRGTSEEAGGFANIEFNPVRSVEGCIYKIKPQELQVLDKCVGYPEHYQHLMLPVWLSNSSEPDSLGVAQYCVPALTFIAQNKWTETEKPLSCDYALSQCIKSADLVTTEYRDSLKSMATQQPITASG